MPKGYDRKRRAEAIGRTQSAAEKVAENAQRIADSEALSARHAAALARSIQRDADALLSHPRSPSWAADSEASLIEQVTERVAQIRAHFADTVAAEAIARPDPPDRWDGDPAHWPPPTEPLA